MRVLLVAMLLLVTSMAAGAAGTGASTDQPPPTEGWEPEYVVEDPVGDVFLQPGDYGPPQTLPAPATEMYEATALEVLENGPGRILFGLVMPALEPGHRLRNDVIAGVSPIISFQLEGLDVRYEVQRNFRATATECESIGYCIPSGGADIRIHGPDGGRYEGDAAFGYDAYGPRFLFEVPTATLVGNMSSLNPFQSGWGTRPDWVPSSVPAGTSFTMLRALTGWDYFGDEILAPLDTRPLSLSSAAPNKQLTLSPAWDPYVVPPARPLEWTVHMRHHAAWAGVSIGEVRSLPFWLVNHASGKRVVTLEPRISHSDSPGLTVRAPPSVALEEGEARIVFLDVHVPSEAEHRRIAVVELIAQDSWSNDTAAHARMLVIFSAPFEPGIQSWTLQARTDQHHEGLTRGLTYQVWASRLAEDSKGSSQRTSSFGVSTMSIGGQARYLIYMDVPAPGDIVLEAGLPATATIVLSSSMALTGDAVLRFAVGSEYDILNQRKPVQLVPGRNEITFSGPVLDGRNQLLERTGLRIDFSLDLSANWLQNQPIWPALLPSESSLSVPVAEPPIPPVTELSPLRLLYDAEHPSGEEFLNPGSTRAFPVSIFNEDEVNRTVEVDVTGVRAQSEWMVHVEPAKRFLIGPGQSARIAVHVTAPLQAKDGARLAFNVTASPGNGDAIARLPLTAIAVSSVEVDEGEHAYTPDEQTLSYVVPEPTAASPGLPLLGVLGILALAVALGRRRA